MHTARWKGWAFGIAALLCFPVYGAELPEQPYRWTCKAQGYFEMKATPDGGGHPIADTQPMAPILITIRRRSDDASSLADGPGLGGLDSRYVVVVQQEGTRSQPFSNAAGAVDHYYSGVSFLFPTDPDPVNRRKGLRGVEAIYWMHNSIHGVLSLQPAEKDWVFFVYAGSLTTDAEARGANIKYPFNRLGASWEAEANVHFLTGPCVRDE